MGPSWDTKVTQVHGTELGREPRYHTKAHDLSRLWALGSDLIYPR